MKQAQEHAAQATLKILLEDIPPDMPVPEPTVKLASLEKRARSPAVPEDSPSPLLMHGISPSASPSHSESSAFSSVSCPCPSTPEPMSQPPSPLSVSSSQGDSAPRAGDKRGGRAGDSRGGNGRGVDGRVASRRGGDGRGGDGRNGGGRGSPRSHMPELVEGVGGTKKKRLDEGAQREGGGGSGDSTQSMTLRAPNALSGVPSGDEMLLGKTPTSLLYEYCMQHRLGPIQFIERPPGSARKLHVVTVMVGGSECGVGSGVAKAVAKHNACSQALQALDPSAFAAALVRPQWQSGRPLNSDSASEDAGGSSNGMAPNAFILKATSTGSSAVAADLGEAQYSALLYTLWQMSPRVQSPPSYSFVEEGTRLRHAADMVSRHTFRCDAILLLGVPQQQQRGPRASRQSSSSSSSNDHRTRSSHAESVSEVEAGLSGLSCESETDEQSSDAWGGSGACSAEEDEDEDKPMGALKKDKEDYLEDRERKSVDEKLLDSLGQMGREHGGDGYEEVEKSGAASSGVSGEEVGPASSLERVEQSIGHERQNLRKDELGSSVAEESSKVEHVPVAEQERTRLNQGKAGQHAADRGPEDELTRSLKEASIDTLDDRSKRQNSTTRIASSPAGGASSHSSTRTSTSGSSASSETTLVAQGFGPTKRDAKHAASKDLLCQLFPDAQTPAEALWCALRVKQTFALEKKRQAGSGMSKRSCVSHGGDSLRGQRDGQRAKKLAHSSSSSLSAEDASMNSQSSSPGDQEASPSSTGTRQQQKRRRADAVSGAAGAQATDVDPALDMPSGRESPAIKSKSGMRESSVTRRATAAAAANRESKKRQADQSKDQPAKSRSEGV